MLCKAPLPHMQPCMPVSARHKVQCISNIFVCWGLGCFCCNPPARPTA
jgi:hypothetical protein